jgi:methylmalonyl-CoA mutase cobalamin-binding subunit
MTRLEEMDIDIHKTGLFEPPELIVQSANEY